MTKVKRTRERNDVGAGEYKRAHDDAPLFCAWRARANAPTSHFHERHSSRFARRRMERCDARNAVRGKQMRAWRAVARPFERGEEDSARFIALASLPPAESRPKPRVK